MNRSLWELGRIVLLLFALCVGIRTYLFFSTFVIGTDSIDYIGMANTFLAGELSEALKYITPPLYPLLLAGMKLIVGDAEIAGKLVSLLAGSFVFFPLYYLGKGIFDREVVLMGLFFFSVNPYLARFCGEALSESTFVFLSVTGLWLLWEGWERQRYSYFCLSGGVLGLSCLTKAQGFIWFGVLVSAPFVFAFWQRGKKIRKLNPWICFSIAGLVFLLVISPYAYFLKGLTGEWTVRQKGAGAIMKWIGHPGSHGFWEALGNVFSRPLFLLKKLAINLMGFFRFFVRGFNYFLIFFLVVGVLAKRNKRFHLPGELYLALVCAVYILGHSLLYLKIRYLLPVVPFCLFWAGEGFFVTESYASSFLNSHFPKFYKAHGPRFVLVSLVCLSAAVTLPETLKPQRLEKLDLKEVGLRIAALSNDRPVLLTTRRKKSRIAFYANAEKIYRLPKRINTLEGLLKYAKGKEIDFIIADREKKDKTGGHVFSLLVERPISPELRLRFTYPARGQGELPRFYVYQLVAQDSYKKDVSEYASPVCRQQPGTPLGHRVKSCLFIFFQEQVIQYVRIDSDNVAVRDIVVCGTL